MSIAAAVLITAGLLLIAATAIGLLRLPDFFSRVHAVSKAETLGIALVLAGLAVSEGISLTSVKLLLVIAFVGIANPIGAHLLTRSALRALQVRDLLAAVAALTAYSFLAASLLAMMGAVDVALTEASLGAGITGVLMIAGIRLMRRRSED